MKRGVILIITLLIILSFTTIVTANGNLYLQDSLKLELDVNGQFDLIPKSPNSRISSVTAELLLLPTDTIRQEVISNTVTPKNNAIKYSWGDDGNNRKKFGYTSEILTKNVREKVKNKIYFPLQNTGLLKEYTLETETIDSTNPEIIAKATELAEGEDDLFKIVFKIANWVEETVDYDLNTLTSKVSQKASWVLKNKQGVCDEMTSLFIAMVRSLGIPARFVKGVSYSTSELFDNPWQAHGWAEVYFPTVGWVSFDVTFGEYGYIDVTHIKLRDGFDPKEPDTKYQWIARDVEIDTTPLSLNVKIKEQGKAIKEEISLKEEIYNKEIEFGSYNMIKGTLKNNADYYVATTLKLAVPEEIKIIEKNKRTILLSPNEERETFWITKVPDNLKRGFIYTFPIVIFSEKNVSFRNEFIVKEGSPSYSKEEIKKLTIVDEEKVYSQHVSFSCNNHKEIKLNEEIKVSCEIKNTGNTNLNDINFCLNNECDNINLPINQVFKKTIKIVGEKPGWNKLFVSAINHNIEKKISLDYAILDKAKPIIEFESPDNLNFNEEGTMMVIIGKESFTSPKNVLIKLNGPGFKRIWGISELKQTEKLAINLQDIRLSKKNKFSVKIEWEDNEGNQFSIKNQKIIIGTPNNSNEKFKMFINTILNLF